MTVVNSIYDFSEECLGQLKLWLENAGLATPISQIRGFTQFTAQLASDTTERTTSSTSYATLTGAPSLSGLPDGQYTLIHGCEAHPGNNLNSAGQSLLINSTAAIDADCCRNTLNQYVSIAHATTKSLANGGSNTVTVQNKVEGSDTAYFQRRWLIALRYANA